MGNSNQLQKEHNVLLLDVDEYSCYSMGINFCGQLGTGDIISRFVPTKLADHTIKQVDTGSGMTFILFQDGTCKTCGTNFYGQLGLGISVLDVIDDPIPMTIPISVPNLTNVDNIACGRYNCFAVLRDGTCMGFGNNSKGELGIVGTTANTPVLIPGITNVKKIKSAGFKTYALKKDGTVWVWGDGITGKVQVTGIANVIDIAVGSDHILFLKSDGTVWSYGSNTFGQLGLNSTIPSVTAVTQIPGLLDITKIACDDFCSLALKNTGEVYLFGGTTGYLGGIVPTNSLDYVNFVYGLNIIPSIPKIIDIIIKNGSIFLKVSNGTYKVFGANYVGQLGIGNNNPVYGTADLVINVNQNPSGSVTEFTLTRNWHLIQFTHVWENAPVYTQEYNKIVKAFGKGDHFIAKGFKLRLFKITDSRNIDVLIAELTPGVLVQDYTVIDFTEIMEPSGSKIYVKCFSVDDGAREGLVYILGTRYKHGTIGDGIGAKPTYATIECVRSDGDLTDFKPLYTLRLGEGYDCGTIDIPNINVDDNREDSDDDEELVYNGQMWALICGDW